MSGLTEQDFTILSHYAREGNRELYWNYLAQKEGSDGYGLLALGVVRSDSMPGATANHFADNRARADGRALDERDWERFGEDLIRRDLALRAARMDRNRPDLALNLPVEDVQRAHDGAFEQARIDPNAWTPRQLLEAARRQGGEPAAEGVWSNMLDSRGLGLARLGITSTDVMWTYNDRELPATRYMGALTAASALASVDRDRTDPNVIGARDFYYLYEAREDRWYSVSSGSLAGPAIRQVTDPARITELDDARAVRLETQAQRDDFHPDDPNRHRPVARSPFTLADAGPGVDADVRLAAAGASPETVPATSRDGAGHPLYQQAFAAISRRDAELGRTPDEHSRNIAVAAAHMAAERGYQRIDDIVFNVATDRLAAGDRFFVIERSGNPEVFRHESMSTHEALAMTPGQCADLFARIAPLHDRATEAQALQRAPDESERVQEGPQLA